MLHAEVSPLLRLGRSNAGVIFVHDLSHLCNCRKPGGLKDGNAVLLGHNLWGVLSLPCGIGYLISTYMFGEYRIRATS